MAAYGEAKQRIFGKQAVMVINRDDAAVEAMTVPPAEPVVLTRFGKPKVVKPVKTVPRPMVRFGLDAPRRPGDFGLVVENGMAWLVRAHPADETQKRRKDGAEEIFLQRLMPADALRVRGRHNAANALAALALATAAGLPMAPMLHGLREYAGEPHRVEFLRAIDGIEAYDDSKGTNVGATVAALNGLGADKAPARLVVILGGDGKGQDFSPLAQPVALYARAVALIGRDAAAVRAALGDAVADVAADALDAKPADTGVAAVPAARFDTLEAATRWCFTQAKAGDAVLLSPACASLDMFRNYGHRAQVFIDTVQAIAEERGDLM
jgi:UDP-N-acetylmuramoylalanine--D-glutamate ligase